MRLTVDINANAIYNREEPKSMDGTMHPLYNSSGDRQNPPVYGGFGIADQYILGKDDRGVFFVAGCINCHCLLFLKCLDFEFGFSVEAICYCNSCGLFILKNFLDSQ